MIEGPISVQALKVSIRHTGSVEAMQKNEASSAQ